MHRGRIAVIVAVVLVAASGGLAIASNLRTRAGRSRTTSGMALTLTFHQTSPGTQHGQSTLGVKGHGTFSVKLGRDASALAMLAHVSGLPFGDIAHGGSFTTDLTLGASGTNVGTVLAHFAAHGLGSACFRFTAHGGQFQPGDSFVPTSGTVSLIGGTGQAARWDASAPFTLKTIGGTPTAETFTFTGTAHGTITSRSRPVPAACR